MGSEHHGAAMASGQTHVVIPDPSAIVPSARSTAAPSEQPSPSSRHEATLSASTPTPRRRPAHAGLRWLVAIVVIGTALTAGVAIRDQATTASSSYLLMPRAELLALPTSGTAWTALKAVADGSLSTPDLCNINANHHVETLAAALVFARTGVASYGAKARAAVMAAIQTQRVGCTNAVLALGRQLTAYVLSANLSGLSGAEDATFRSWLSAIRTKVIGGHPIWNSLVVTHLSSPNNWGAYAGASRIAADLYLGDSTDLSAASRVTRGFLGDRASYAGFTKNLSSAAVAWSCTGDVLTYTPENGACTKSGINLDGGVAADISRGGSLHWPPADPGIPYQLEAIQGVGLQTELLYRNGYSDAWSWSNNGLKRAAAIVTRSAASGGTGWNATSTSRQMPWLLNLRYGTSIPTRPSGIGRAIGFTDWLYGSGAAPASGGGATPPPTPKPTPKPTPRPTPTPPSGGGTTPPPSTGTAPTISSPTVRVLATTVPTTGVPATVRWSLASSSDGLKRFDLQVSVDGGAYTALALPTSTTAGRTVILAAGHRYAFRARAIDRSGRVGAWVATGRFRGMTVNDSSTSAVYRGSWGTASYAAYLGGRVHYTRSSGATTTVRFSGSGVTLIGPKGPGRGKSAIYIDGHYVATIDQVATGFVARRALFVRNLAAGTHTLVVKALGTAARPMVAVDAIEVLAPA
jgi:hypothetical protein